jgi:hypothetical protein
MIRCKDCRHWRQNKYSEIVGSCKLVELQHSPMFTSAAHERLWTTPDFGCIAGEPKEEPRESF